MCGSPVPLSPNKRTWTLRRCAPVLVLAALTGACSSAPAPATFDLSAPSSRIRGAAADAQLISELRRFEIATPGNEGVVEISAKIVSEQNGRIVNGRIFRGRVPAAAVDAPNAARALDDALSVVMLDIVRWVSASQLPRRDAAPETTSQAPAPEGPNPQAEAAKADPA